MEFFVEIAPPAFAVLATVWFLAMLVSAHFSIPRHGGKAHAAGYSITDNPFPPFTEKALNWEIEWLGADVSSRNKKG